MKLTHGFETKRRTPGLALLAVSGLLMVGCGGTQANQPAGAASAPRASGDAAGRSVSAAARRTLSLTAEITFRLDGSAAFGPARAPVFGRGSFDLRSGKGEELIDLPEAAHQERGNEHAILLPAIVYLQPRGTTSGVLPAGKAWVSATIVGSESVSTNFPQFVGQVEGVNPVLALSELAWGTAHAQPLGIQLVDRAPAERYRVTVDLRPVVTAPIRADSPAIAGAVEQQLTALGAGAASSAARAGGVTFYVWVDRARRIVEYRAELPGTGAGTALVQLGSFGKAVHIGPPSRAQVVDITALTPSGERENNGGGDSDGG